ncbi:hypothetical protein M8818_002918 [Zalaria obscura]|uniref:Uncharacterized protein n=1 Tax=Zalaria obscura TaxID=2024903 RepID=A0ACC3SJ56_9PEZI
MPGVKAQRAASRIEHSDSEDDFATSDRENGNPPTPEKGPIINRNKVSKVTKARAPTKTATAKKATAKTKAQREALKDRTNLRDDSEIEEEVEEAEDMDAAKPKAKKSRAKPQADVEAPAKKPRAQKTKKAPLSVIPETQQNAMEDVSQSIEVVDDENMDIDQAPSPQPKQRFVQRARSVSQQRQAQPQGIPPRARSTSQQPPQRGYSRGRSASDTERRMPDSEMKRKLAEMTQKYEDLQLKYENLQELGRNSAETNFDKLKRASDQRAKDANELIASLKKELAELRKNSSTNNADNTRLQTQISHLKAENEKLTGENKTLQTSASESTHEIKALTARLDAAKKAATSVGPQVPGSAIKSRDNRAALVGNLDSAKQAHLKEELYRDLTGLIINSVKRKDGEDEYSCIQTGRNGTLHFHLTINNDSSIVNPKTPSGLSYEDAEFAYEPFFDNSRDQDLIDILPDYLTEEICFPRNHAVKFYTKVVDSMTKKIVVEE